MAERICVCGHPEADHTGTMTAWSGRVISRTACLADTSVARASNVHAERVGGDRCREWDPQRRTLRDLLRRAPRNTPAPTEEADHG